MSSRILPPWVFREFEPVGTDLASTVSVSEYDRNQRTNSEQDNELLDRLGVGKGTVLVDFGCGTGSLIVRAALRGAESHRVDVAENMLAFSQKRADDAHVEITLHNFGYLTHAHAGPIDVATSSFSLHQLPDTWKQVAITRISAMLAPGGLFYLRDVMWSFHPDQTMEMLPNWIDAMARPEGEGFTRQTFETHVREEFSTFSWVLEGMLERAGLQLDGTRSWAPWYGEMIARRVL